MSKNHMPARDRAIEHWLAVPDIGPADAGHRLNETDRRDWCLLRLVLCVGVAVAVLGLAAKLLG